MWSRPRRAVIEKEDAAAVAGMLAENLAGVSRVKDNFRLLPDASWGYFALGHDGKGRFGLFVAYSEAGSDLDGLLDAYKGWADASAARGKGRETQIKR